MLMIGCCLELINAKLVLIHISNIMHCTNALMLFLSPMTLICVCCVNTCFVLMNANGCVLCFTSQHVCETDDRDEVVVCELCEANVANFNQHMKKSHPGCGRSANRQGYRSNGSYVDGWFGGECGSGNPYYLLCGGCREKYLAIKSKAKVPIVERYAQ